MGMEDCVRPIDIIMKKRNGNTHTQEEIVYLIQQYTEGRIPDYQMAAWLMAAFLNGLDEEETYFLTHAMLHSGKIIDLSCIEKPKIDKHSTGGVGDKISLILAPAVASCGIAVPMTSGRGLGFSGGTLDKLESIPGYRTRLTEKEFVSILGKVGFVMSGQTDDIAPADKKLYALRDVTGTVENIAFITSSILSKKLAEGAEAVVMDVKFGSGAFMKAKAEALCLAETLLRVAGKLGKNLICVLTSMDQPLGNAVGNRLEVIESIECLNGEKIPDLVEITCTLGGYMLIAGKKAGTLSEGKELIEEKLKNGEAFERFVDSVRSQGGDVGFVEHPEKFERARFSRPIHSTKNGFINKIHTENIGTAAVYLGAGRFSKDDEIDPAAGIIVHKKLGSTVRKGEKLLTLYYNKESHVDEAALLAGSSYTIGEDRGHDFQLMHEVIG
jgi:pyrimidine-nucleoside phosphorylase